ncbi:MAG: iron-sulfur cluster assembly accessory protein [Candidatus Sungbacteria bacterium]|nr:iron-sulfur cluster assembly accessory protein [Candidatus Sungbacteria bacterium]
MAIEVTETALKKIKGEMVSRGLDPKTNFLRIGVRGGGCSGFSYQLEFDTERNEKDKTFDFPFPGQTDDEPKLTVLVDVKSYLLVNGATLDYSTEGLGGFVFANPNAKSSCGCGQSFHT